MSIRRIFVFPFLFLFLASLNAEWVQKQGLDTAKNMMDLNGVLISGNAAMNQRSSDFGESWEGASSEFPEDGNVRDYFVTDGKCLFAMFYGVDYDALYRSDDMGRTWKQILKKNSKTLGRVHGLKGRVVINSENHDGYYISTDRGDSWTFVKGCLVNGKNVKADFFAMAELNGSIFVSRSTGPLIVSTDDLKTFKTVEGPEGKEMALWRAGIFLLAGQNGFDGKANYFRIHTSGDGGKTWSVSKFGAGEGRDWLSSAVEHKDVLYITLNGKIGCSRDHGKSWQDISENLLPFMAESGSRLAVRGNELGLQGSVHFWTRKID
jgi:photosystem II stability/assembly factor-like uncharacterized protein